MKLSKRNMRMSSNCMGCFLRICRDPVLLALNVSSVLTLCISCGGGGGGGGGTNGDTVIAPAIVFTPESQALTIGQSVKFSVVASGTTPLTYEWKKDDHIVGVNSPNFTIPSAAISDVGSYTVTVANSAGSVTAGTTLTVPIAPSGEPEATTAAVVENLQTGKTYDFLSHVDPIRQEMVQAVLSIARNENIQIISAALSSAQEIERTSNRITLRVQFNDAQNNPVDTTIRMYLINGHWLFRSF